ncbi:MAG: hypothetical protein HOV80_11900 [Polyangiaceae bacterium]|nr:hypothetical protein [Polyangiaceae bacterium]
MAETYRSDAVSTVRRNRIYLFAGAFPYLLAFGFLAFALFSGSIPALIPVPHLLMFGTLGLAVAYRANKDPVYQPGELEISDTEVRHAGRLLARRDELVDGVLVPNLEHPRVQVRKKGFKAPLLFGVKNEQEGHALLRALGFDVTQSVAELRGASDILRWSVAKQLLAILVPVFGLFVPAAMASVALLGPSSPPVTILLVLALVTYVFTMTFSPTKVRIGVDGVVLRWMRRERFVPFSRVKEVRKYQQTRGTKTYVGVELLLRDGGVERIVCGQAGWIKTDVDQILGRIKEAYELHKEMGSESATPNLLARGARTTEAWVTALRGIGAGANTDLRTAPVPAESLLRVVEDASASPALRVGAAVAALAGQPDAKPRIRVAATTTASPKLRIALERVADAPDDEQAIAEAIAEVEAAEAESTVL